MSEKAIRVLILEDVETDAELVERELRKANMVFTSKRVDTKETFIKELTHFSPDIILSDYSLPQFNAFEALRLVKQIQPDVAFILITGSLTEELVVEFMKEGIDDYLLKTSLKRLPTAIINVLEKKEVAREKQLTEERLGQSEAWLRAIFDASRDGILVEDDGTIVYVNNSYIRMLGYDAPEELIGNHVSKVLPPFEVERMTEYGKARLRGETPPTVYEFKSKRKDGSLIEHEAAVSTSVVAGKTYITTAVRDITERKRAEESLRQSQEQLIQAQKMESIGTLAGGVAHDFNNILTAILGNTQLALRKLKSDDPLQQRLIEIEKATNRASALTSQLLAFSRRQELERRNVNLNNTIEDLLKMLRRLIGADVELHFNSSSELASVLADPAQIEQVIMNLVVNARDAMPQGGQIIIETSNVALDEAFVRQYPYARLGKYVQIVVSDNGVGMDAGTRARIFEPFFTTKEIGKGTGLGLAMVFGIVKQHDGLIHVNSEVGQGTSFKIYLPVIEQPAANTSEVAMLPLCGGVETILVADDEEPLRNLAKEILEELGYTVLLARDGLEAVEIYTANRRDIDLVVLDVVMPRMGGYEAYQRMREANVNIPLIFVTGYNAERLQTESAKNNKSVEALNAVLIQKPYSVEMLGRKVREVLDASPKS